MERERVSESIWKDGRRGWDRDVQFPGGQRTPWWWWQVLHISISLGEVMGDVGAGWCLETRGQAYVVGFK